MTLSRSEAEYIAYIVLLLLPPPRHGVSQGSRSAQRLPATLQGISPQITGTQLSGALRSTEISRLERPGHLREQKCRGRQR